MHETARDLKAELDSKMGLLQHLIRAAAREREQLEAAIARAEHFGLSRCRDTLAEIERATSEPNEPGSADPMGVPLGQLPPAPCASRGELPLPRDQQTAVYRLADLGHSPAAISEQLGMSLGDVEMMLSVRSENT
jgi:hypothetical protein